MAKDKTRINAPGRGNKTPADVEAIFAEEYLRTGIISVAAKRAGIPQRTGTEVAERLESNPDFTKRRRELLTRGLDRVESMLIKSCETASKRVQKKPQKVSTGEFSEMLVDNGHHYMRALSDAHRSLVARSKLEHDRAPENKPQWPSGLRIIFDGTEKTEAPPAESEPCQS